MLIKHRFQAKENVSSRTEKAHIPGSLSFGKLF